ncbi:hypothetical protein [Citrobacter portucalensis]|uniref:hypothetical protein n=1 Tax=Citrobacter portucalensis TaxID=1639133 RepID=UPI00226B4BDD|nr:hypothetical protein [Citrobacter portucalensis]MCX8986017.1 hypothetical protein [Citrobacter portucalensis]
MAINNVDFSASASSYQTEEAEETKEVSARHKVEDVSNQRRVKDISEAAGQKKKNPQDRGKKFTPPLQEALLAKQLNAAQRNPSGFFKKNESSNVELFYLKTIIGNPYAFDSESIKYAQDMWTLRMSQHNVNDNLIHKVIVDDISVEHVLVLMAMCRDMDSLARRKRSGE